MGRFITAAHVDERGHPLCLGREIHVFLPEAQKSPKESHLRRLRLEILAFLVMTVAP